MSNKLYVGNLAFQTTSQELQELFAQAGTVESASVVEDRMTGRSRGFAFVEMSTPEEATAAIDQFNGKEVGGRALGAIRIIGRSLQESDYPVDRAKLAGDWAGGE